MVRPPTDLDTVNQPFAPHPYVIVAAPNASAGGRAENPIPLKRLMREPFVVREKASDTWHSMEEGFGGDSAASTSRWKSAAPKPSSRR
jgi:DNA-binding transcriptional LysR family regulator